MYQILLEASAKVDPSLTLEIFSYMNKHKAKIDATAIQILQSVIEKMHGRNEQVILKTTRHTLLVTDFKR